MKALALVPAVMLLALAACSDGEEPADEPADTAANEEAASAAEETGPVELDLADAQGACPFIDSALLDSVTGEEFRFASGGSGEDADEEAPTRLTCAVQTGEAFYPDLTLFVIGTEASAEVYEEELADGTEPVDDLGEAAYWIVHTEDTGAGPALEMGWYEGGTIFELRYTTPEGTDAAVVEGLVGGFADLSKGISQAHADSAG
jgi:hypothetical protein